MAKNGPEARSLAPRGSTLPCSSGPIELSLFDLPRPVYSAHSRTALISGLLEDRTVNVPAASILQFSADAHSLATEPTEAPFHRERHRYRSCPMPRIVS